MKKIAVIFLIYSLLLLSACPNRVTLERAKRESGRLATYANETTNAIRDMFRAKIITGEQTVQIADKLILLSKGGQSFDLMVQTLAAQYGQTSNVPPDKWAAALALFNAEVVERFIDVLTDLKIIKPSENLSRAINLIITAVKIIARAFKVEESVKMRLASVQ